MENMGYINSLLNQPMLRDILADAGKYFDAPGLLKTIRDLRAAAISKDIWIR